MEMLMFLVVLGLLILLTGFALRCREKIARWLNCPTPAYEESLARRKTILKRKAEDAQAEIEYIESMEEAEKNKG